MATITTKDIPYQYNEPNISGGPGTTENIKLIAKFNTETKRTEIYQKVNILGPGPNAVVTIVGLPTPTEEFLIATIEEGENTIKPVVNENNQFNVSNGLKSQLNTPQLKQSIQGAVSDAIRVSINPSNPIAVSQQQIDNVTGGNSSATAANPDNPPVPGGNAGTNSPNPSTPGSSAAPSNPVTIDQLNNFTIPSKTGQNTREKLDGGTGLRYPEKTSDEEDYIKFQVFEYKPKTLNGALNSPVAQALGSPLGECILPIQSQISDSNIVGWGDGRINAIELEAFRLAKEGISGGLQNAFTEAGKAFNKLLNDSNVGTGIQVFAAGQAAQVNNVFARTTGGILNPNLELLFEGPELRTFNFQFQLSPRGQEEATRVRKIIRFFKLAMSVQVTDTDIFLKSPNVFKITYIKGGQGEHKSLNRFKTCALRSFDVDYTPLGTYMTFDDPAGTMVSYGLSMQFQEIDPIYNSDYDKFADDEIGL